MALEHIAIIGGGASGALTTIAALQNPERRITLVDSCETLGLGVAYGAASPSHLLNSYAMGMSFDPSQPQDFVNWCETQQLNVGPLGFAPRQTYGRYLVQRLNEVILVAGERFTHLQDKGEQFVQTPQGPALKTASGAMIHADRFVLCLGNDAPVWPGTIAGSASNNAACHVNPWAPGVFESVDPDKSVLLVGTGLTAVDVALSLHDRGQRAPMVAVSRHGLLPQTHRRTGQPAAMPEAWPPVPGAGLGSLVHQVRSAVRETGDWWAVMDNLRPHLDQLWWGLSRADQERFLARLGRFWEIHRHRMSPQVSDAVKALETEGLLQILPGGVRHLVPASEGVQVSVGNPAQEQTFGAVINCTGPGPFPGSADELLRSVVTDGQGRADHHGLGLDVARSGAVIAAAGEPQDWLWTVGPARRGVFWETTAIGEIRTQAYALAETFDRHLAQTQVLAPA